MSGVARHYDELLAPVYSWMAGGQAARIAQSEAFFAAEAVTPPAPDALALDLGAGSGFQAIPLARRGFRVQAIDTSAALLAEIDEPGVAKVCADLRDFERHAAGPAALIVCMGDTLTHLPAPDDVWALFAAARAALAPGGRLILSWRDLSAPPRGLDRFFNVRADARRIFTCFLEDEGATVRVHDLLQELDGGAWTLKKSSYSKLKLPADRVRHKLELLEFADIRATAVAGLTTLTARRP